MADLANLEKLIDRQTQRWALGGSEGMPQPRGPCVAISRVPQAGGSELGARVAAYLDYGFFGRDEVDAIAENWSLRGRLAEGLDTASQRRVEARAKDAVLCRGEKSDAVRRSAEVMSLLGERGMAVLIGGGAAALVPTERALRVLVVAPASVRAERLVVSQGVDAKVAPVRLKELDCARADFLRDCFGREIETVSDYDLAINTEWLLPEAGAALVIDGLRRRFPPSS